jgi:excisionase family DNA binding protein
MEELFTIAEAARKLGFGIRKMRRLVDDGAIECVWFSRNDRRVSQKHIDDYVAVCTRPATVVPVRKSRTTDVRKIIEMVR